MEMGYDRVKLELVAKEAGVSRGALSWHFKTKEGLLTALRAELQEPFDIMAEALSKVTDGDPMTLLEQAIDALFDRLQHDTLHRRLKLISLQLDTTLHSSSGGEPEKAPPSIVSRLEVILAAADRFGPLALPWSPRTAAVSLAALLRGLIGEWALGHSDFSLSPHGLLVVRAFMKSLR